ncbi:MAG: hypothetical protein Q9P44_07025 [Anaerolineae bacterium]|nr:hypothetical protein [Anaerolineae bacterium]
MPTLARYFIKSGMIYFVIGLLLATVVMAQPVFDLPTSIALLRPTYLHLLTVGWITQVIVGVAYWMFPKYTKENPRGNERLGWAIFLLLNTGIILRTIGEPLVALYPTLGAGWLLALSGVTQLLGGWGFIINTWSRVKER